MKNAVREKKKETPYEKLRGSVVDYLDKMFKKHLRSPLSMPCHEIFYYDDLHTVKQRLNGTPRVAIQKVGCTEYLYSSIRYDAYYTDVIIYFPPVSL